MECCQIFRFQQVSILTPLYLQKQNICQKELLIHNAKMQFCVAILQRGIFGFGLKKMHFFIWETERVVREDLWLQIPP